MNYFSTLRILLEGAYKGMSDLGIGLPIEIFRWVKCGITDHKE
jgi:hypothetical protein